MSDTNTSSLRADAIQHNPSKTIVVHEVVDDKTKMVATGFVDGHVEELTKAAYEKALTETIGAAEGGGL